MVRRAEEAGKSECRSVMERIRQYLRRKAADFQLVFNGHLMQRNRIDVKDRVNQDIGAKKLLEDWADIDWRLVDKRVRNLRQRIFRATESGKWNQAHSLMKLMLRSYSNLLQSVRKVTQDNKGRKTPGIDRQKVLTPKARLKLVREMSKCEAWKVKPARRVYIPKADGKQRPLGILTIKNRVAQAIMKNAIEPSWEARFEPNSYGFRPGRSTQDAIQQCWTRLNKRSSHNWVLDADVRAAFDNIRHDHILERLGNVPGRELIRQWLKAGYVEAEMFHDTASGVPQGGVISPILANIALDGLEAVLRGKSGFIRHADKRKPGYIRYADDFVVTMGSREELEALVPTVEKILCGTWLGVEYREDANCSRRGRVQLSWLQCKNLQGEMHRQTTKGKGACVSAKDSGLATEPQDGSGRRCHSTSKPDSPRLGKLLQIWKQQRHLQLR